MWVCVRTLCGIWNTKQLHVSVFRFAVVKACWGGWVREAWDSSCRCDCVLCECASPYLSNSDPPCCYTLPNSAPVDQLWSFWRLTVGYALNCVIIMSKTGAVILIFAKRGSAGQALHRFWRFTYTHRFSLCSCTAWKVFSPQRISDCLGGI